MKLVQLLLFTILACDLSAQWHGNTSPTYAETISYLKGLDQRHSEIELYAMGPSDFGEPIYLCIINGAGDSLKTMQKARSTTTLLINNAIHPGEPDGINASLIWIDDWVKGGKKCETLPVIAIIPAYNVGGMMNRSGTSRANQNGPEEYGFRGNAQNLDLNRDFVKMDSKNMFTFAKIYHAIDPDVFVDTHVSNGADYQYTMTYIASIRDRMPPVLGDLTHDVLIPHLKERSSDRGYELIPYVNLKAQVPDSGIVAFDDLPRYAMGYAAAMNSIAFTTETHMLKAFPKRVEATRIFLDELIRWTGSNGMLIERSRAAAAKWEFEQHYYPYNHRPTEKFEEIVFKGYRHTYENSPITQRSRLKYHQDQPVDLSIRYFDDYSVYDSIAIPSYLVVGGQCADVILRLEANGIQMETVLEPYKTRLIRYQIRSFESPSKPYEGHFPHTKIKFVTDTVEVLVKKGDKVIDTRQKNRFFILSLFVPDAPDSYFVWNFFDSYAQQKEHFSPYVFEEVAWDLLKSNHKLREKFEAAKANDPELRDSPERQLYFIYKHSPYFEPSYNVLPYFGGL